MRGQTAFLFAMGLAAASAIPDRALPDESKSVVRIKCVASTGFVMLLRGAVVDTGYADRSFDVVLTAAHGLPDELDALKRQCTLVGERDRHYTIRAAWRADPTARLFADDWAVLLTDRGLRGDHARYPVAHLSDLQRQDIALVEEPVRLPLLTALEEQECSLEQRGLSAREAAAGLLVHTCRSWQGHSGSPILARVDGRIAIVGVHLASRWLFEERRMLKIGRYVDGDVFEAIGAAIRLGSAH